MKFTKTKAIIKRILIAFKYLLIFFVCFIGIHIAYSLVPNLPKQDLFFIQNARLPSNSLDCKNRFLVKKHYIEPGPGVVLAFRWFHNPRNNVSDDEVYKKLTIWLESIDRSSYHFGESDKIKAYYTEGNAAFPKGNCGGELTNGELKILTNENKKIIAEINFTLKCLTIDGKEKRTINLSETFDFQQKSHDDLTPWLGGVSDCEIPIYRETYRK